MIEQLRAKLRDEKVDVFLVTASVSRRYLTGFTGSAGLVWIDQERQMLITDFRYIEQAASQCPAWEIVKHDGVLEKIKELSNIYGVQRIAIEGEHITINQLNSWDKELAIEFVSTSKWVQNLRIVKSAEEICSLHKAAQIADEGFTRVLPRIKPGVSELDIALDLDFTMRRLGAMGVSFEPIVASGPNAALPHARPSQRCLQEGDFVVIDFGCVYQGYCSDMTRTLVIGTPTEKQQAVYSLVLKAQLAGLNAVGVGKTGVEIDKVARDIINAGGYRDYFGHGLGHGVGLEVHEEPRLSKIGQTQLRPGMVVTVEPGIYLPGWGGVRIEDLVVVTEDGVDILSSTSKELHVVE